ncbi:MAG: histidinol-phosphatase, partial [Verrucomicrobia bacterium]|nr:histidinol-phosphatase [Verrucomicrobiota bacterium]
MQLPADYHMHTPLCHHAKGEPIELAATAVARGLDEIGFSEHGPMLKDDFDNWHLYDRDFDAYIASVETARREFPQLKIRIGLEVDYLPGHEEWIRGLAKRHPWDYFIGSVHYISDAWDIDNPTKISEWKKRDPWDVWSAYFDRLTQAAESGLFEIIGHADLPKKFCFVPGRDCSPLFEKLILAMKKGGIAYELNTAGLRKDCKEIYPCPKFVQMA